MTEKVGLFGEHINRPDVQKKLEELLQQRQYGDYLCYLAIKNMGDNVFIDRVAAKQAIDTREKFNDLFMRLIAGDLSVLDA